LITVLLIKYFTKDNFGGFFDVKR